MCLFDTDEVVRTMAEAMGRGRGCRLQIFCRKKNALSPTDFHKGGERAKLGSGGMGCGRVRARGEQTGGPLPPAAQTSEYC